MAADFSFCTFYWIALRQPLTTNFGIFQCFTDSNKPSYLKLFDSWFIQFLINCCENFDTIDFIKIRRKKSNLASGNRSGEKKFITYPPAWSNVYQNFKKQKKNNQKSKTRIQRKAKETKEEKIISSENRLKK